MRLITVEQTEHLLPIGDAIAVLEQAYRDLGQGRAVYRPRSDLVVPRSPGRDYWLSTMEGALLDPPVAAIRLRSDVYEEREVGGQRSATKWAHQPGQFCGLVLLYHLDTAEPLALLQDGYLQLARVAATSAVAAKYLARPDSHVLGLVGAGWQARMHARALAAVLPLTTIKVYARRPKAAANFAGELEGTLGIPVSPVPTAQAAVQGSDVVATCTTAQSPVVDLDWLEPGTHLTSIRYYREIEHRPPRRVDRHVVHPREYGWHAYRPSSSVTGRQATEAVDLYAGSALPNDAVPLEEVVAGHAPGRTHAGEITVFNNHAGMGIQFAALGAVVWTRATTQGIGRELPLDWFLQNVTT
ncbi:MAG: ornithine cyclodeaminase family protein [Firmicutes bacterium]|nr:ornithine cyclodeaminase family protein [Bacillota bacterium]